jgi:hypothetical protein
MKKTFCLLIAVMVSARAADSTLKGFQSDASAITSHSASHYEGHHSFDSAELDANVFIAVLAMAVYGSAESWARVAPVSESTRERITPRNFGEPLIPFATVEADAHYVNDKIDGLSGAFEVGFGPVAFRMRQETFTEQIPNAPDAELKLTESIGLLRLSGGDSFELDLGGGEITLDGETRQSQTVFTTPIRFLLAPWFGVSFRPTWGSGLSIYDLAIEPGFDFLRLRLGYRWCETDGKDLSGPYAGASLTF